MPAAAVNAAAAAQHNNAVAAAAAHAAVAAAAQFPPAAAANVNPAATVRYTAVPISPSSAAVFPFLAAQAAAAAGGPSAAAVAAAQAAAEPHKQPAAVYCNQAPIEVHHMHNNTNKPLIRFLHKRHLVTHFV